MIKSNTIKSRAWLGRLYEKLEDYLLSGHYIVMLTFTIKDMDNLKDMLDILNNAWRNFGHNIKSCRNDFKNRWLGGVKSLEVKTGANSKQWHCHYHCIMVKNIYSYDEFYLNGTKENGYKSAWRYCVELAGGGPDNGHVDIKTIYCKDKQGKKQVNKEALLKGIVESVKYISKFDYLKESKERLRELVEGLYKVRQINTFGCLSGVNAKVDKDLKEDTSRGTIEHICKVCHCNEAQIVDKLTQDVIDNTTGKYLITDDWDLNFKYKPEHVANIKKLNGIIEKEDNLYISEQLSMRDYDSDFFGSSNMNPDLWIKK